MHAIFSVDTLALEQDRLGFQIAHCLDEKPLPAHVQTRLKHAQDLALARLHHHPSWVQSLLKACGVLLAHLPWVQPVMTVGRSKSVRVLGVWAWGQRVLRSWPLGLLWLGLVTMGTLQEAQKVQELAHADLVLLSDDLPAQAYTDSGFMSYLQLQSGVDR